MCRLAAFPPGYSKEGAIAIIDDFSSTNDDGTGYAYVDGDKFMQYRTTKSFKDILKDDKKTFLDHMPHKGWTIFHVRQATHGAVAIKNTHPFIRGSSAVVHNGIWSPGDAVRFALSETTWEGETDSEVAAYLIDKYGANKFYKAPASSGVYLQLHVSGKMTALKCSGELQSSKAGESFVFASQLPFKMKTFSVPEGWIRLNELGVKEDMEFNEKKDYSYAGKGYPGCQDSERWNDM